MLDVIDDWFKILDTSGCIYTTIIFTSTPKRSILDNASYGRLVNKPCTVTLGKKGTARALVLINIFTGILPTGIIPLPHSRINKS